MTCQNCDSKRLASVSAKCNDSFWLSHPDGSYSGTVPPETNLTEENRDYLKFTYCLDCGQIQGTFPVKKAPRTFRETSFQFEETEEGKWDVLLGMEGLFARVSKLEWYDDGYECELLNTEKVEVVVGWPKVIRTLVQWANQDFA